MRTIVVSAVNLRKGGTLAILHECLAALSQLAQQGGYRIVALVHKKELAFYEGVEYIELPWSVRSWAHRCMPTLGLPEWHWKRVLRV